MGSRVSLVTLTVHLQHKAYSSSLSGALPHFTASRRRFADRAWHLFLWCGHCDRVSSCGSRHQNICVSVLWATPDDERDAFHHFIPIASVSSATVLQVGLRWSRTVLSISCRQTAFLTCTADENNLRGIPTFLGNLRVDLLRLSRRWSCFSVARTPVLHQRHRRDFRERLATHC